MIRLVLYGIPCLLPLAGLATGGALHLLALVTVGALFCAAAFERELDRVAPLPGDECAFCGRPRQDAVNHPGPPDDPWRPPT